MYIDHGGLGVKQLRDWMKFRSIECNDIQKSTTASLEMMDHPGAQELVKQFQGIIEFLHYSPDNYSFNDIGTPFGITIKANISDQKQLY